MSNTGMKKNNLFPKMGTGWEDQYNLPTTGSRADNAEIITLVGDQYSFAIGFVSGTTAGYITSMSNLPQNSVIFDGPAGAFYVKANSAVIGGLALGTAPLWRSGTLGNTFAGY